MTPERWQAVKGVVEDALGRDPATRSRFLDDRCADDTELRREVAGFLEPLDDVDHFLEAPLFELGQDDDSGTEHAVPISDLREQRFGPYRILDELGRGGMATVYLAARDDDEFEQRVALKLISSGSTSRSEARRFRSERQILASLEHPNIARLLDGGRTDDGRPFFVMELIDGTPIDEYCNAQRLTLRQRLELFREVCKAVAYAHRNLVVHRDIKPANILVTADGTPKLLDFGIAKLLDPTDFPATVELTRTGLRPMTPAYASPEQASGRTITTASDVYSLGVLLYKLLTDQLPRVFPGLTAAEIDAAFTEEMTKPSVAVTRGSVNAAPEQISATRRASPRQLRRKIAGDLDNITLKALMREAEERYPSVEQLSEDIGRYLDGEPVLARQAPWHERARKFARRHKVGIVVAASFLVVVLGFSAFTAFQSVQIADQRDRAESERERAESERDRAEDALDALVDLFGIFDPGEDPPKDLTAKEVIDRSVKRLDRRLRDRPAMLALVRETTGRIYRNLSYYDRSIDQLEQALAIRQQLGAERDIAKTLGELGSSFSRIGRTSEAESVLNEAIEVTTRLLGPEHQDLATLQVFLAEALIQMGEYDRALAATKTALPAFERPNHRDPYLILEIILQLSWNHVARGELSEAEDLLGRAIELHEDNYINDPGMALILDGLAHCAFLGGNHQKALEHSSRALSITRSFLGPTHIVTAERLNSRGLIFFGSSQHEKATLSFKEALSILEENSADHYDRARVSLHLANSYRALGLLPEAGSYYRQNIANFRQQESPPHPNGSVVLADSHFGLGVLQELKGNELAAKEAFEDALSTIEPVTIKARFPRFLQSHVLPLLALGRLEEAKPIVEELLDAGWKRREFLEACREHGFLPAS